MENKDLKRGTLVTLAGDQVTADTTLEAIVTVLRNLAEYHTHTHGVDSPEWNTLMSVGFLLADKLHGEGTPERRALLRRMFANL